MPSEDTTPAAPAATLIDLAERWTIAVGPRHRRYVGGPEGQRFATDGGQMVIVDETEYARARELGWGVIPKGDHWTVKASLEKVSSHFLSAPSEVATATHGLALRYGCCWLAGLYVDVAIRLGGTRLLVSTRTTEALVPDLCIIMPFDMEDHVAGAAKAQELSEAGDPS